MLLLQELSRHHPRLKRAMVCLGTFLFSAIGVLGWADKALAEEATPINSSIQPYLEQVAERISEFTLENGMKFIVLERHQAPVVSFMLYADVGAVNEADGETGLAHYLEHLAFKGTTQIGTLDYAAEKPVLDAMDAVFAQILTAEQAGQTQQAEELRSQFEALQQQAAQYIERNEYGLIVQQAGGVGLNATTSVDATRYFYSLPSNKLELWMSLESERFLEPVFREFYEEKEVVLEERSRKENDPYRHFQELFKAEAFQQHPYRRPVLGYEEDLRATTRAQIQRFFETYYGPSNLTVAIVGDVDPVTVRRMAEVYFGRFEARGQTTEITLEEPPQTSPREFTVSLASQPRYLEGYHRPDINHPDHVIYRMIGRILTRGRTSRLYKDLVENQQIALSIYSWSNYPNNKYPSLVLFSGRTAPGYTLDDIAQALHEQLDRLVAEPVSPEELERVRTQSRANLLWRLDSNSGMASLLAEYEAKTGSWRNVFKELETIESVTVEDIQRVAKATFRPENRTVGKLLPAETS